jgi:hypothetical protein
MTRTFTPDDKVVVDGSAGGVDNFVCSYEAFAGHYEGRGFSLSQGWLDGEVVLEADQAAENEAVEALAHALSTNPNMPLTPTQESLKARAQRKARALISANTEADTEAADEAPEKAPAASKRGAK